MIPELIDDCLPWLKAKFRVAATKDILYHYTRTQALLDIIRSERLRASDVLFMNDAGELAHATTVIQRILRKACYQYTAARPVFGEMFDKVWELGPPNGAVFAFCLTENGDQLSQWRAYGGSTGYSLGFRVNQWTPEFSRTSSSPTAAGQSREF